MSDAKPPSPPAQAPKSAGEGDVKDAKGPVAVDNAKGPGNPTVAGSAGSPATIGSAGAGASPGLTHPGVGPVPGNPGMPINPNPLVPADPAISGATTHAGHADFAPDMPPRPIRVPAGDPGSDPRAQGATVEKVDPVVALRNVDVRKVASAMRRAAIDSEGPTQAGPDGGATVGHDGADPNAHADPGPHRARMALGSLLPARVLAFLKDAQDDEVAALLEFARQRLAVEMARALQMFAGTGG